MKLRTFLSYLEDCIEDGYEESLLCVEDEDYEEFPIVDFEEIENGDIILYGGSDTDFNIQDLYEELEDCHRNANIFVKFDDDDEDEVYNIKGSYFIDDDDDICFNIKSSCQKSDNRLSVLEQAKKDHEIYEAEYKEKGEEGLDGTLNRFAARLGIKTVYMVLWLYYALSVVPAESKIKICGALGYLISFVDIISDLIPFLGLTDDVAVITAVFVAITKDVSDVDMDIVSTKAKAKLRTLFPNFNESDLD